MPQVAEYLLFIESTFRFHTTQHSKQMLSPCPPPPSGHIFTWSPSSYQCQSTYELSTFYLSKLPRLRRVPNFNVGLLAGSRTPYAETFMCVPSIFKTKQLQSFNIITLYNEELCEYAFAIGYPLYTPQSWVLGVLRVNVEILCSKALPYVNTRALVYRMSKSIQRPKR